MSRRKDRERFLEKKRLNPDYAGFRGINESGQHAKAPLQAVKCSVCGRKRNVPLGVALESGNNYVCLACRQKGVGQSR